MVAACGGGGGGGASAPAAAACAVDAAATNALWENLVNFCSEKLNPFLISTTIYQICYLHNSIHL